jgi:translocator protein
MSVGRALRLLASLALPFVAGILGGWATVQGVGDWYLTLQKPSFNPPGWVFGPVWTLLYVLMGIALFLIWEKGTTTPGVRGALVLFGVQLAMNAFWPFLFFWAQAPGWALAEILILWVTILGTTVLFFRVRAEAGWLMTPYLGWVTFAAILNYSIWTLNP